MYFTHGINCRTKTFPLNCQFCSSRIFFFQCECGSRVLFDMLGDPWPMHDCRNSSPPSAPRPPGKVALQTLKDVSFTVEEPNSGLLLGLRRGTERIPPGIIHRSVDSVSKPRETVSMDPYGERQESIVGVVSHIYRFAIGSRFSIDSDTLVASAISSVLGGLDVAQITVLVDDYLNDESAVDKMSYAIWCHPDGVPASLEEGHIVEAIIRPRDFMSLGKRWVANSMERMI